jgi:hypothetical protein
MKCPRSSLIGEYVTVPSLVWVLSTEKLSLSCHSHLGLEQFPPVLILLYAWLDAHGNTIHISRAPSLSVALSSPLSCLTGHLGFPLIRSVSPPQGSWIMAWNLSQDSGHYGAPLFGPLTLDIPAFIALHPGPWHHSLACCYCSGWMMPSVLASPSCLGEKLFLLYPQLHLCSDHLAWHTALGTPRHMPAPQSHSPMVEGARVSEKNGLGARGLNMWTNTFISFPLRTGSLSSVTGTSNTRSWCTESWW